MRPIEEQLRTENAARLKRLGVLPADPRKSRDDMQELQFCPRAGGDRLVAKRAGVDRSDWSMAMEPGSLAFFDGILSGIHDGRSYYLKEDLIFEILSHLRDREPVFRKVLRVGKRLPDLGYPFGHRIGFGHRGKELPPAGRRVTTSASNGVRPIGARRINSSRLRRSARGVVVQAVAAAAADR